MVNNTQQSDYGICAGLQTVSNRLTWLAWGAFCSCDEAVERS